jgi:hypothetical protein
MFLPVEITVDGEEEDASKIFWIGFTDDRKTKFNGDVTFKRHYEGPDCWSKWFNDVNRGKTQEKQVELSMHVPHQPKRLHSIKMTNCLPTKWEAGGKQKRIEVITLTCETIVYGGFKDIKKQKQKKKTCTKDSDPRDCLSNEEYAKYKSGDLPFIPDQGNGAPKELKPKFQKCNCKDPESVMVVSVPSSCGCQEKIVPVTHYIVQKADPRDYMQNEPYKSVYGLPAESSVSGPSESSVSQQTPVDIAFGRH